MRKIMKIKKRIVWIILAMILANSCILPAAAQTGVVKEPVWGQSFSAGSLSAGWVVNSKVSSYGIENGALKLSGVQNGGRLTIADTSGVFKLEVGETYNVSYKLKGDGTNRPSYLAGICGNRGRGWLCVNNEAADIASNYVIEWYDTGKGSAKPNLTDDWITVSYDITLNGAVKGRAVTADDPGDIYTKNEYTPVLDQPLEQFAVESFFINFNGTADTVWIDDIKIVKYREAVEPSLTGLSIGGTMMEGSTVNASVQVNDPDRVLDGVAYQWELSGNGQDWRILSGEQEIALTSEQVGNYLRLGVSLQYAGGAGDFIYTDPVQILARQELPSVQGVTVTGDSLLTAAYTYVRPQDGAPEGESLFQWEVSEDGETGWERIPDASGITYAPSPLYAGRFIRVRVIPVDENGVHGHEAASEAIRLPDEIRLYVSADAAANGNGSITAPYATFEQARDAVRQIKAEQPDSPITVYLRGGEYFRDSSFALTAQDSGSIDAPITYQAYPGEQVLITGGVRVSEDNIQKVTDTAVAARVLDPVARETLMQIDLSNYYDVIPEIGEYDYLNTDKHSDGDFANQVQIYVNGSALKKSRWPNDSELVIASSDGKMGGPTTFGYHDSSDRAKLWNEAAFDDLRMEGHPARHWCYATHSVTNFDAAAKTMTTKGAVGYPFATKYGGADEMTFYFFNLLEEIDLPGESYIDRDKKIAYFYPFGEVEEVIAPVTAEPLLSASGVSNVSFLNLDFAYVRSSVFSLNNVQNVVIDGCNMSHFVGQNILKGDNNVIRNCCLYDGGMGGVRVEGGDSNAFTGGGNLIENNRFRALDTLKMNYSPAIALYGYHQIVRGNDISESNHMMIYPNNGNDHLIEFNEIHDGCLWTGDMAAIYWGRNPQYLGIEIGNNYFHDIGSEACDGWVQSVFWDDGQIGPYLHDNIFYRATLTADRGGKNTFALKTYGGVYARVENNIFVDVPYAAQFQNRGTESNDGKQRNWWLQMHSKAKNDSYGWWGKLVNSGYETTYPEHYAGTIWDEYVNGEKKLSSAFYEANLKNLDPNDANDWSKLLEYAQIYAPALSNLFQNNVAIQTQERNAAIYQSSNANAVEENTYWAANDRLPSGNSHFVEYGRDFTLTGEGLAAVRAKAPDFRNIDASAIGLKPYGDNGKLPGGAAPEVQNALIFTESDSASLVSALPTSSAMAYADDGSNPIVIAPTAQTATTYAGDLSSFALARYDYTDADGDEEGTSEIEWFLSDQADGPFGKIAEKGGPFLAIESGWKGKYLRYEVKPIDRTGMAGEKAVSETIQIGSLSSASKRLEEAVSGAEALYAEVAPGAGFGQSPEAEREAFRAAIDAAKAADAESEEASYQALSALLDATGRFRKSVSRTVIPADNMVIEIHAFMEDINIELPQNVAGAQIILPTGQALHEMRFSGYLSVDGTSRRTTLWISEGTVVENGTRYSDNGIQVSSYGIRTSENGAGSSGNNTQAIESTTGKINIPFYPATSAASVAVNSVSELAAYPFGGAAFSQPVRLEVEQVGAKMVGYVEGGKAVTTLGSVSSDTSEAASGKLGSKAVIRYRTGNNLVLWAARLPELLLWSEETKTPPPYITPPPYTNGGSGSNSGPSGGNNSVTAGAGNPVGVVTPSAKQQESALFSDIIGHWAKADIEEMANRGVVSGVGGGLFEPDRAVTRAEFATMIAKALDLLDKTTAGFEDVPENAWYYSSVNAAANAGLVAGYDGWFRPDDLITREEMAVVIAKASASLGNDAGSGGINRFADRNEISGWAYEFVDQAATAGLISGMTADTFAPLENTTRAQAVAVIWRLIKP